MPFWRRNNLPANLKRFLSFWCDEGKNSTDKLRWGAGRGPIYPHLPLHVSRRALAVRPSRLPYTMAMRSCVRIGLRS
jgi:hypothetical protein